MRFIAIFLVLVVGSPLAGCLGRETGPGEPGGGSQVPLYMRDCTISNWIDGCTVLASPNAAPSKAEIEIIANPKDPKNVIVASKDMDRDASGCVWAIPEFSKDAGQTWHSVYIGGKRSERRPGEPLYGWGCITDPIMAFDNQGYAYYALQAYNAGTETNEPTSPCVAPPIEGGINSGSAFFLARSTDGGASWPDIIPLHAGEGNVVFHDYPRMASNPVTGSTFVIWNQINTFEPPCVPLPDADGVDSPDNVLPVLSGSRDRGMTPIEPVYIVDPRAREWGDLALNGFAIDDTGESGTMYVTLEQEKDDHLSNILLVKSTDDGRTWSSPVKIFEMDRMVPAPGAGRAHTPTTKFRAGSSVELAVDTSDGDRHGCLYGAWVDNATGDTDILSSASCDGGKTWSSPVRVNFDNTASYELMTRNVVDAKGVVHVAYLTQAFDPGLRHFDAMEAFSEDGGVTWVNQRLTEVSSDGDLGIHQDGGPFFGDYIGIAASGTTVYVGFPETATSVAEIGVARLSRLTPG